MQYFTETIPLKSYYKEAGLSYKQLPVFSKENHYRYFVNKNKK